MQQINFKTLYTSFQGRIGRQTFWIGLGGIVATAAVIQGIIFSVVNSSDAELVALCSSVLFVYPALALYAKRIHDVGKPTILVILLLVPLVNIIWVVMELGTKAGVEGENEFGPNPVAA